ncbi:hypothetical protein [Neisseria gonorrhoeae]|uniref:hypothetical protein n=1 Tax=Neisseria gonorrhoeae TaxID=485 RepID=UPI001649A316|nr:hypothetical protein [Neisseria gonorrhoeae]
MQIKLFDKMGIPTKGLKKTAKGGISTNEACLLNTPDAPDELTVVVFFVFRAL